MATDPKVLEYRKVHDLCPRDGRPNKPDRKMCEYCLEKAAEKTDRHRQKKKDMGLCLSCGKKVDNVKFCDKCKKSVAVTQHNSHVKRYGDRKSTNQCTLCSNKAIPEKTACQQCLDKRASLKKEKYHKNLSENQCIQCSGDPGDLKGKRCQTCIDKRNAWYQGSTTQSKDKIRRDENREAVLKHYGYKCICCGETKPYFLAIDHIKNDGNTHRKEIGKYGSGFYKWLVDNDFPEGFQILCHNCNVSKHLNSGICPHQNNKEKTQVVMDKLGGLGIGVNK